MNDCDAPPVPGLTHVRTRQTEHGARNFEIEYDRLVQGLPSVLTHRQQDWAEVLSYLYAIDLACPRGEGADWQRDIQAWLPVRDVPLWSSLASELVRVFGALTYDHLQITFVQATDPLPPPRQSRTAFPNASGVALLSGGADSFVGAAMLLEAGERPLFVSHKNSGAAGKAIKAILPSLRQLGAPADPLTITARRQSGEGENSQRSRTMLYVGLACLVASAQGSDQVWLNENGVMAVHVPLSEARIGSFSTRTASPDAIDRLGRLAHSALGRTVSISNVLITMTKPEVVASGRDIGVSTALAETVSCWSIGRRGIHCGHCAPCLMRQVSFEWAGISDVGHAAFPWDALPTGTQNAVALDNLSHMIQLAVDLREFDDDSLLIEYSELLDVGMGLTVSDSMAMHRRWADQLVSVASEHAESAKYL